MATALSKIVTLISKPPQERGRQWRPALKYYHLKADMREAAKLVPLNSSFCVVKASLNPS